MLQISKLSSVFLTFRSDAVDKLASVGGSATMAVCLTRDVIRMQALVINAKIDSLSFCRTILREVSRGGKKDVCSG